MGHVYILRNGEENLFKIGRTEGDIDSRVRTLSTGNPRLKQFDLIETDHAVWCEAYLCKKLRPKRCLSESTKEFFEVPPEEMSLLVAEAREFLEEYTTLKTAADNLKDSESDGVILTPGGTEWSLYRKLLAARQNEDTYHYQRLLLEYKLKIAIGKSDSIEGIATWRTQVFKKFDRTAFREAEPEMFQRYVKDRPIRIFRLA